MMIAVQTGLRAIDIKNLKRQILIGAQMKLELYSIKLNDLSVCL
jgi:hypothetical protein